MVITLGQQYNVGEKPAVILYTYINRHAGTPTKGKTKQYRTSSNNKDKYNTIIETRTGEDPDDENLHNPETVKDAVIHLEVDEEQKAITQGGKRQAERTGFLAPYLSGLRVLPSMKH